VSTSRDIKKKKIRRIKEGGTRSWSHGEENGLGLSSVHPSSWGGRSESSKGPNRKKGGKPPPEGGGGSLIYGLRGQKGAILVSVEGVTIRGDEEDWEKKGYRERLSLRKEAVTTRE